MKGSHWSCERLGHHRPTKQLTQPCHCLQVGKDHTLEDEDIVQIVKKV